MGTNIEYDGGNSYTSVKGSFPKQARFNIKNSIFVAPNSYHPEISYSNLENPKCSSVFSKRPMNTHQFKNSSEYTMIGDSTKHMPTYTSLGKKSLKRTVNSINSFTDKITIKDIYNMTMAAESATDNTV